MDKLFFCFSLKVNAPGNDENKLTVRFFYSNVEYSVVVNLQAFR